MKQKVKKKNMSKQKPLGTIGIIDYVLLGKVQTLFSLSFKNSNIIFSSAISATVFFRIALGDQICEQYIMIKRGECLSI